MMERLFAPVRYVKGVGPQREKQLNRLGIYDLYDLLWHLPRDYMDRRQLTRIRDIVPGETVSVCGTVRVCQEMTSRRGMKIIKAVVNDASGNVNAVWFNQQFIKNLLKPGTPIYIKGKASYGYGSLEVAVSEYEILDREEGEEVLGITPIYPSTEGLSQKTWRRIMGSALEGLQYPRLLPSSVLERLGLPEPKQALYNLHCPAAMDVIESSRRSLALEEFFILQLAVQREKARIMAPEVRGIPYTGGQDLVQAVIDRLQFGLTAAQQRVVEEIFRDMERDKPMNRLVQGDVGAGKTVVAALAMAKTVGNGYQAAFMAPTEILASQHYENLKRLYGDLIQVVLLTGKTTAKLKDSILEGLASGDIQVLVGTHALLEEDVNFRNLGLAVIDEQHRFGVRQRSLLSRKGEMPDVLVMSATPIPRTLALTIYGDLDISTIDQLPPGRKPVKTLFVREQAREKAYRFLLDQVKAGFQCYVVCPLVEESEKQDLMNATSLYQQLQETVFRDYRVGLLHGRMKAQEKAAVMEDFKQGRIAVLVSTTVIEVGVDVPNATVMLVEEAERFGLSQLHQLRGRVGRGSAQAYCILLGNPRTEEAFQRLKVMERTQDGFEIANEDMRLRGPGDLWGLKQHGLPDFKAADLFKDTDLLEISKRMAEKYWEKNRSAHPLIEQLIEKKFSRDSDVVAN